MPAIPSPMHPFSARRILGTVVAVAAIAAPSLVLAQAPKAASVAKASSAPPTASASPRARRTSPKSQTKAPSGPIARNNVAVATAAIPAAPGSIIRAGCVDEHPDHRDWLGEARGAFPPESPDWRPGGGAMDPVDVAAPSEVTTCTRFASVQSSTGNIRTMALLPPQRLSFESSHAYLIERVLLESPPSFRLLRMDPCDTGRDVGWVRANSLLEGSVPDHLPRRWVREVTTLVRLIQRSAGADTAGWVRLVGDACSLVPLGADGIQQDTEGQPQAVELVDESGQLIDSAIWMQRSALPSGFVSARGADLERVLWQSPLDHTRISRGVGSATVVLRRKVTVPAASPDGKPKVMWRQTRAHGKHEGIDYAAPKGTPVMSVADGTIRVARRSGNFGNLVVVDHGAGITTHYAHLSAFGAGIAEGVPVGRGQEVGLVGSTGRSTGPHLHFEIRRDGKYLDPADPKVMLPNWALSEEEQAAAAERFLALSITRRLALTQIATSGGPSAPGALAVAPD